MSKIALPIAELKPALTGLGKVIAKRMTLPVLSHIKIERTKDGWIALTGTDLDAFVTVRLEQPSQGEPLSLLVPYDELAKTAKNCPKTDSLLLDGDSKAVTIQYPIGSQVAETKVDSLAVKEFPETPRIKGEPIPVSDAVRQSIHDAMECASTDETRLILNGAYLDVSKPNAHYVVGTDGHHLFSSNSFALPLKDSLLIPMHRFLDWKEFNADGEWQLRVGPKEKDTPSPIQISSRRWRFISRQIEGKYPNWPQAVPDGSGTQTTITVDPEAVEAILQTLTRMPDHDPINHGLGLEVIGHQVRALGKSSPEDAWTRVSLDGVKIEGKINFIDVRVTTNTTKEDMVRLCQQVKEIFPMGRAMAANKVVGTSQGFRIARAMSWGTSLLAIVVGVLGVMNTMMMTVFERTQEICVLLAIGWTRGRIMRMVLWESALLGFLGGVTGTLLGVLGVKLLVTAPAMRGLLEPDLSPRLLFTSVAIAMVVGVVRAAFTRRGGVPV